MTTALRKSARTLQHLVAVFGGPAWALKSGKIEVQAAPVVPLKAKAPKTSSAPVCPACGAAAGIMLPENVKEVAILVVGGFHRASYEIYAHVAVAERLCMPLARISSLIANLKPVDLIVDEAVAFDVAYSLCRGGFLPEPIWRLAVETFGDLGAAQLIYLVGVYAFVSTCLNGFDVPAPERLLLPMSGS